MDKLDIVNPEDKKYTDGHLWQVDIENGYDVSSFYVYANCVEDALYIAVANAELTNSDILYDFDSIRDYVYTTFEDEYREWLSDKSGEYYSYDESWFDFAQEYLGYMYVDATEQGASQPYFIEGNNLQIKEVNDEPIIFESKEDNNEFDVDKALKDIQDNVPVEIKHLGDNAYEYKGLFVEIRPETIFTDNTPPEMDFAVFEKEEDMDTDYELNIGTDYPPMIPYYRYWEAVMLFCDKLLNADKKEEDCTQAGTIQEPTTLFGSKELKTEYYQMPDDEHIIWDSEINYYDDDYMANVKANQYQDYLDNFEPGEPLSYEDWLDSEECYDNHYHWFEDSGIADGDWDGLVDLYEVEFKEDYDDYVANYKDEPLPFDKWYDNYIQQASYDDWEYLEDDLKENICPAIDKQLNDNILLLSGSYGSNYSDFRPSGNGGVLFEKGTEEFRQYMGNFDGVCITTQNGILGAICSDHDGTVSGQFYTLPDDTKELIKAMGYEDIVRKEHFEDEDGNPSTEEIDDIEDFMEDYFYEDLRYGEIDARDLNQHIDLLKPIKDTISGYAPQDPNGTKTESKDIKTENNKIPRNWKKITYKSKIDTNVDKVGDTIEVERDEWGRPIATNLRTGKTALAFLDMLRNDEISEIVNIETADKEIESKKVECKELKTESVSYQDLVIAGESLWRDDAKIYETRVEGIYDCQTAGHGGYLVDTDVFPELAKYGDKTSIDNIVGFEEDYEALKVIWVVPEVLEPIQLDKDWYKNLTIDKVTKYDDNDDFRKEFPNKKEAPQILETKTEAKFTDKVKAIKKSLKKNDKRLSDKSAEKSAEKIAGSMTKKEESDEQESKFNSIEFEKQIPNVMRWKEWSKVNDNDLFWVTQQFFNENDVKQFAEKFKNTKFDKAFVTVRDLSTYEYEKDLQNKVLAIINKDGSYDIKDYLDSCKEAGYDDVLFESSANKNKKVIEAEDMKAVKDDVKSAVERSNSTKQEKDQVKGSIDVLKTDEESAINGYDEFNKETTKVVDKELADTIDNQMQEIVDDEKEHIEKLDTIKSALGENKKTEAEDLSYIDSDKNNCKVYYAVNTSGYKSLGLIVNDKDKKFQVVAGQKLRTGSKTAKKSKKQIWDMAKELKANGYEEVRGPSSVAGTVDESKKEIKENIKLENRIFKK